MARSCCFCGGSPVTLEHIYPNWLAGHFPKRIKVTNEVTGKNTWQSSIFQHKAKIVCSKCNNGWMSKLEDDTKPLLEKMIFEANTLSLSSDDQTLLAYWAQKTTLMINRSTGGLQIPDSFYKEMYEKQVPLKSIAVLLGWRMLAKGTKDQPLASYEINQIGSVQVPIDQKEQFSDELNEGKFAWTATIGLGKVVFQLFGHNLKGKLDIGGGDARIMSEIFPVNTTPKWPNEWPVEAVNGLDGIRKGSYTQ